MTTKASNPAPLAFDELLGVAPVNDVQRCAADDPVAGMTLVRQIAASVARRLPSYIERDELISLGAVGWTEARQRFDASRGVPFAGFAAMRIRGAILDGLRQSDTLSRGDRRRARLAPSEIPTRRVINDAAELEMAVAPQEGDISDVLAQEELIEELRAALEQLPERERLIVRRHFFEDVPMRTIGAELGVTESRISQIISAAIGRLRTSFSIAVLPIKRRAGKGGTAPTSNDFADVA